jgi:DNA polymerase V
MNSPPNIGLIDCNNFFVSCERLFRPDLQDRPVIVLSSNDGCVVARSQEVKDMGIPMGVPYFQIKDIIKKENVTIFSGNMPLYRDISRRVFDVVRDEVQVVEQYSVDEAFFVIPKDMNPTEFIKSLKDRIETLVGMPVSIGVASSKTRAKFASSVAKKQQGIFVCDESKWLAQSELVRIESIWGVGAGLAKKFALHGIKSVADLSDAPSDRVQILFGVAGQRLQAELRGVCTSAVDKKRPLQKSLMSSRSFAKTTSDKSIIKDALAYHVRHIAADLRAMDASTKVISISLRTSRHGDFFLRGGSADSTLVSATNDTFLLLETATSLLDSLFDPEVPYQKVGVVVRDICPSSTAPASLFAETSVNKSSVLQAIDIVNNKVGRELITIGSRLQTDTWQSRSEKRSPAYTTRWSDIADVSA